MYLIKLISEVKENRIPLVTGRVAAFLGMDVAKIEKILSKGPGIIGKVRTIEKAEKIAAVFRDAGVEVALVEDEVAIQKRVLQAPIKQEVNKEATSITTTKCSEIRQQGYCRCS